MAEFHLLERRVQRELGAAGRNTKPAKKCLKQAITFSKSPSTVMFGVAKKLADDKSTIEDDLISA